MAYKQHVAIETTQLYTISAYTVAKWTITAC